MMKLFLSLVTSSLFGSIVSEKFDNVCENVPVINRGVLLGSFCVVAQCNDNFQFFGTKDIGLCDTFLGGIGATSGQCKQVKWAEIMGSRVAVEISAPITKGWCIRTRIKFNSYRQEILFTDKDNNTIFGYRSSGKTLLDIGSDLKVSSTFILGLFYQVDVTFTGKEIELNVNGEVRHRNPDCLPKLGKVKGMQFAALVEIWSMEIIY